MIQASWLISIIYHYLVGVISLNFLIFIKKHPKLLNIVHTQCSHFGYSKLYSDIRLMDKKVNIQKMLALGFVLAMPPTTLAST